MAKRGRNLSAYMNAEVTEKFDRLMAHMGYGPSQTIANLVDVRDKEIEDGVTRRQTMKDVQEGIAALRRDVNLILSILVDKKNESEYESNRQDQINEHDNLLNQLLERQERLYREGGMSTGYRLPEDNDPTVD